MHLSYNVREILEVPSKFAQLSITCAINHTYNIFYKPSENLETKKIGSIWTSVNERLPAFKH